jgi:hypothetical protein
MRISIAAALALAALAPQEEGFTKIFNGKDFTGWTHYLKDGTMKLEDVWSVDKDGVITCKGKPNGYIRTTADYKNFVLKLEWRWHEKPGNSGVFVRVVGEDKIWPKGIEAQLMSGHAGDFWLVDGTKLDTPAERKDPKVERHRLHTKANEKPVGEWNAYEITVDGDKVTLKVNGEVLNEGTGAEEVAGKIILQSEGAPIQSRLKAKFAGPGVRSGADARGGRTVALLSGAR